MTGIETHSITSKTSATSSSKTKSNLQEKQTSYQPQQVDMFAQAEQTTLKNALVEMDLDNMTPFDAMTALYKLKSQMSLT